MFGIGLFTADGVCVYGTNTHLEDFVPRRLEGEAEVRLTLEDLRLVEGTYLLDVAAHRRDGTPYDYHRGLLLVPRQEPGQGRGASTGRSTAGPSRAAPRSTPPARRGELELARRGLSPGLYAGSMSDARAVLRHARSRRSSASARPGARPAAASC